MAVTVGLLGDTMLGRKVAERVLVAGPRTLFAPEIAELLAAADLVLANLECCISEDGMRWPSPGKPFFFRAPPVAVQTLTALGVTDVTLANNHALDYGIQALGDTLQLLTDAGIRVTGAGPDRTTARQPIELDVAGVRLAVLACTDHPAEFAAGPDRPGVAYADLSEDVPPWLLGQVRALAARNDLVLVTPHWGPNMTSAPSNAQRRAANRLIQAGATVVAGHSAHVFHGVAGPGDSSGTATLFDLGDFLDDYMVHPGLRNDLGLIWLLTLDRHGPVRLRAVPIALDYCYTRLADEQEYAWIATRLTNACAQFGTEVVDRQDHLAMYWT